MTLGFDKIETMPADGFDVDAVDQSAFKSSFARSIVVNTHYSRGDSVPPPLLPKTCHPSEVPGLEDNTEPIRKSVQRKQLDSGPQTEPGVSFTKSVLLAI